MRRTTTSSWSGSACSALVGPAFTLGLTACTAVEPAGETAPAPAPAVSDVVGAVDPFIGTGGPGFRVGSSTPAATTPFGLVKLGPDTSLGGFVLDAYHCSGYYSEDDTIDGFSHVHLHGVGAIDYGTVLVMPVDGRGDQRRDEQDWESPFSKATESASPGFYEVTLDNGIRAELSATPRTGVHRYTFPAAAERTVMLDLEHVLGGGGGGGEVHVDPVAGTFEGYMIDTGSFAGRFGGFPVYFVGEVRGGIAGFGTWADGAGVADRADAAGIDVGAWFLPVDNPVTLQVGISLTSVEGARRNLAAERVTTLEEAVTAAQAAWEDELATYTIHGATEEEAALFYTAAYHLLQMPTRQSDVDGAYRGFDKEVHPDPGRPFYSDMSLWDTYRSAHPAYTLFHPAYAADFAQSLVMMAQEGGAFPRWPAASGDSGSMLGAPADIVLADTFVKGVTDWDVEAAWPLLVAQAVGAQDYPYNNRPDPALLGTYGYYPSDMVGGSVAWTQELAWADDALATFADALGDADAAAFFEHRSYTFANQYDPATGFFRGRDSAGAFSDDFNEIAWEDEYVEGNAWQYLWMPPAHAATTAALLGGEPAALTKLEAFFHGGYVEGLVAGPAAYYWHGNEPDIHAPFLFTLWGDPGRTATWQRWVEDERYFADPDGLAGNDDAGTLSAWYLFSTLGFYPIAGTDRYILGAPRYERASFRVEGGEFTVVRTGDPHRRGQPEEVVGVWLDDVPLERWYLRHAELTAGRVLTVEVRDSDRAY